MNAAKIVSDVARVPASVTGSAAGNMAALVDSVAGGVTSLVDSVVDTVEDRLPDLGGRPPEIGDRLGGRLAEVDLTGRLQQAAGTGARALQAGRAPARRAGRLVVPAAAVGTALGVYLVVRSRRRRARVAPSAAGDTLART